MTLSRASMVTVYYGIRGVLLDSWRDTISLLYYLILYCFFKDTQSDPRSTASFIFSLFCYSTSPPLTAFFFHADFPLFSPFYLLRIIPFTVFIHFRFILHASLFLILLPRPLHSPLQHPAMQTQPVLRGSELLKPLLPFPLCTTGLQRKEGGNG